MGVVIRDDATSKLQLIQFGSTPSHSHNGSTHYNLPHLEGIGAKPENPNSDKDVAELPNLNFEGTVEALVIYNSQAKTPVILRMHQPHLLQELLDAEVTQTLQLMQSAA